MKRLKCLALASVLARSAALAADSTLPPLVAPPSPMSLHIAVPLPGANRLDPGQRWALAPEDDPRARLSVALGSAQPPDGKSDDPQLILATLPPAPDASAPRQFRVVRAAGAPASANDGFRWTEPDDKSLVLWEGSRRVLVYNHGTMSKPDVPANRNRSTYVHPIYGLDGEVLTDDFPKDHYHHRGLFWAWPHVGIGGRNYDLWDIRGIHQRFERWLDRQSGAAAAVLGIENGWYVDDRKVMQERVWLRIYPASEGSRVVDVSCAWIPQGAAISLAGAPDKSYGGMTLRFAPRTSTVVTTPLGNKPDDLAMTRLTWADFSGQFAGAPSPSGAAIFISPDHPDYPPTWLTRHYGALCVGWPGVNAQTFQPGQVIRCDYRVWIHRGQPSGAELAAAYAAYESGQKVSWSGR